MKKCTCLIFFCISTTFATNATSSNFANCAARTINTLEIQVNGAEGPDKNDPNAPNSHVLFAIIDTADTGCKTFVEILATATSSCAPISIVNDSPYSDTGSGHMASGLYPKGTHTFSFFAIDSCGTIREEEVSVTVVDGKPPQVEVLTQAIGIWDNSWPFQVAVDPTDFNGGCHDNCTDDVNLSYTLQLVSSDDIPLDDPQNPLVLGCDHIGVNYVRLIVTDASNNSAYKVTTLLLEDPNGHCESLAIFNINAKDQFGTDVPGLVSVSIFGSLPWISTTISFPSGSPPSNIHLQDGSEYCISMKRMEADSCKTDGISTIDIIKIRLHLLSKASFTSPYQWIAADIDGNYSISTIDIIHLRRLILDKTTDLPNNNEAWKFVESGFVFLAPNPLNHFNPADTSYISDYSRVKRVYDSVNSLKASFVAIKVGDLTLDADPECDDMPYRPDKKLGFGVDDRLLTEGEVYEIAFKARDFSDILGCQFTLSFEDAAIEFVDYQSKAMKLSDANFNFNGVSDGKINMSWDVVNGLSLEDDEELFTMSFKSHHDTQLSEVLAITSEFTNAEAYSSSNYDMGVALKYENKPTLIRDGVILHQNEPNPFDEYTTIRFDLPEAAEVYFNVYDVTGMLQYAIHDNYQKGRHEMNLDLSDIDASGVLFYELRTSDQIITKKMTLLR